MSNASHIEVLATTFLALAVIHTFAASSFQRVGNRFKEGSVGENFFHLLGEVEVVFGLWAGLFLLIYFIGTDSTTVRSYLDELNYTEPVFVFVILVVCATRPIRQAMTLLINFLARMVPIQKNTSKYFVCLGVAPLLGSFITEPAAMTVIALLMKDLYFDQKVSKRFLYLSLATLFVNISIGGTLTPYAAPPVLMVANQWGWDLSFMMTHFGYKVILACILNGALATFILRTEISKIPDRHSDHKSKLPLWIIAAHLFFLGWIVSVHSALIVFMGIFLFFLGLVTITKEYQEDLKLREGLLVAFFLGGLVVLGRLQSWWLQPTLASLSELPLFLGATALTAITDNAALTYLGAQVPDLSESMKYALVAGAVAGGGLTVIANAPNPAGYSILQSSFGKAGVSALHLLRAALIPTMIAMLCLWILPSL